MTRLWFLLLVVAACGGTSEGPTTPGGGGGGSGSGGPAAAGDVTIDLPPTDTNGQIIKGFVFNPEALGRPGIPQVNIKVKIPLAAQIKKVSLQKSPIDRQAEAAILAQMYYNESKTKTGAAEKADLESARQALRDAAQFVGGLEKSDPTTLRLLGPYELRLDDYAGAEEPWHQLVAKSDPKKDKDYPTFVAWYGYTLLKQNKNKEALDAVKGQTPSDKEPELAYVIAWAKMRNGDDAGAWDAILTAEKGANAANPPWSGAEKAALDRDVLLFAGRAPNVPFATAMPQLFAVFNAKQPGQQYEILAKLGLQSYGYAGRWAEGVEALDKALATGGAATPPNDVPVLRYSQADFEVRLDAPDVAAKYAKQALDAIGPCGAKCKPADVKNVVESVAVMGRLFHILYATANDVRYYEPANALYIAAIPLIQDQTKRTEVNRDAETLQRTFKNTKAGTGTHDKGAVGALLGRHLQEVQACYEQGLLSDPKLGGSLVLTLESDATGGMKGASTEPKSGQGGLAGVATCIENRAKTWKLPKRGSPGTTRIKIGYTLGPKT